MRHHAKAFGGIDQHDLIGNVRAGLRRRGARDQRGGVDDALAAGALLQRVRRAACAAEAAAKILQAAAHLAALIDDGVLAYGPVGRLVVSAHLTRSRNMLTCEDSTPPSPCSNATEASRT